MTKAQLHAIIKQAIIQMGYSEGIQINTFFQIDRFPDLNNEALGANMSDFNDGRFWSRDWANSGADPNAICAQWPIAIIEDQDITAPDLNYDAYILTIDLVLLDRVGCDTCPDFEKRTAAKVQDNMFNSIRALIKEIMSYQYVEIEDGGETRMEWASEGLQAYYQTQDQRILNQMDSFETSITTQTFTFTERGIGDQIRGWGITLQLELCEQPDAPWKYPISSPTPISTQLCDNC